MIEINNLTEVKIDKKLLNKITEKILKKEKKKLDISVALARSFEIKKLNKKYRKKNKITDVLSFLYDGSGEIIICPEQVKKNAEKFGTTFKKELSRIMIHGVLHLLGEEHEVSKKMSKKMERKEKYYLNSIFE